MKSNSSVAAELRILISDFFRYSVFVIRIFGNSARLLSVAAILIVTGCHQRTATILGNMQATQTTTVAAAQTSGSSSDVTLTGIIIEKCPVAGCWFRLRDTTGIIRVDTRSAGFAVVKVPLSATVTVSGKLVAEGDQIALDATGLRY